MRIDCKECGAENPLGSNTCWKCGAKLSAECEMDNLDDIFADDAECYCKASDYYVNSEDGLSSIFPTSLQGFWDFISKDQEKEGRKSGACDAAKYYEPILERMKKRYEKLEQYNDQAKNNFQVRSDVLLKLLKRYEDDTKFLQEEIDKTMMELEAQSPEKWKLCYDFLERSKKPNGGFPDILGGVSSFHHPAHYHLIIELVELLGELGERLYKRNAEKFRKYYEIGFEKTAEEY